MKRQLVAVMVAVCVLAPAVQARADVDLQQLAERFLNVRIGGFCRLMYYYDNADDPLDSVGNSYFRVRNARPKLTITHSDQVKAVFLLEAAYTKAAKPVLLDGWVEWTPTNSFALRLGQYRMPFSREMLRPAPRLFVYDRGRGNRQLGLGKWGYLNRDVGVMATFERSCSLNPRLAVGIFNGAGMNTVDTDDFKDIVARGVLSPLPWLELGANYHMKKLGYPGVADSSESFGALGLDFLLSRGPVEVEGEFLQADNPETDDVTARDLMLAARFHRKLGSRLFAAWELGGKLEMWDPNTDADDDGSTYIVFGPAVYLKNKSRLQLNLELESFQDSDADSITRFIAMWTVLL